MTIKTLSGSTFVVETLFTAAGEISSYLVSCYWDDGKTSTYYARSWAMTGDARFHFTLHDGRLLTSPAVAVFCT